MVRWLWFLWAQIGSLKTRGMFGGAGLAWFIRFLVFTNVSSGPSPLEWKYKAGILASSSTLSLRTDQQIGRIVIGSGDPWSEMAFWFYVDLVRAKILMLGNPVFRPLSSSCHLGECEQTTGFIWRLKIMKIPYFACLWHYLLHFI